MLGLCKFSFSSCRIPNYLFQAPLETVFFESVYCTVTLEIVKGEFESFGELLSVRETGMELLFHR